MPSPTGSQRPAGYILRPIAAHRILCASASFSKLWGVRVAVGAAAGGSLAGPGTVTAGPGRRMAAFREPLLGLGLLILAFAAAFAVRAATDTHAATTARPSATATVVQGPVGIVAIKSIPAPGPLKLAPAHVRTRRPAVSHRAAPPVVAPPTTAPATAPATPAGSGPVQSTSAPNTGAGSGATSGAGPSSGSNNSGSTSSGNTHSGSGLSSGGGTSGGSSGSSTGNSSSGTSPSGSGTVTGGG
jgi:hypothetical protein